MGVGLNIKQILRDRGMTIKELSIKAGVSLNTLYSITKRDSARVDSVILQRIADVLGVSVDNLLGKENPSTLDHQPKEIHFNSTPDPEWTDLYQKLEAGSITDEELKRFVEMMREGLKNVQKVLPFLNTPIAEYTDKLNKVVPNEQSPSDPETGKK